MQPDLEECGGLKDGTRRFHIKEVSRHRWAATADRSVKPVYQHSLALAIKVLASQLAALRRT